MDKAREEQFDGTAGRRQDGVQKYNNIDAFGKLTRR